MLDFIARYWLEVVLGLIASGLGFACKKIYALYIDEKNRKEAQNKAQIVEDVKVMMKECSMDLINKIEPREQELKEEDKRLHEQIDKLENGFDVLKEGILSLQGRNFRRDCRELLKEDHIITSVEYESIVHEHKVYNSLGGNHRGDALFQAVETKYKNSL